MAGASLYFLFYFFCFSFVALHYRSLHIEYGMFTAKSTMRLRHISPRWTYPAAANTYPPAKVASRDFVK